MFKNEPVYKSAEVTCTVRLPAFLDKVTPNLNVKGILITVLYERSRITESI